MLEYRIKWRNMNDTFYFINSFFYLEVLSYSFIFAPQKRGLVA